MRNIIFASPHCLVDFTSGAAIATMQMLQLLQKSGFACQAFCGARLDAPEEALLEEMLASQGSRYETRRVKTGNDIRRMIFTFQGDVPITIFQTASTRGKWLGPEEIRAFLRSFATFLDRNRPNVIDPRRVKVANPKPKYVVNGIPVLASSRGALPEIVGDAEFLFDIPARYTPTTKTVLSEEEVHSWVETIIRLWDDPTLYHKSSQAAEDRARIWHPEQLTPKYTKFFQSIFPQPGPPFVPR